MHQKAIQLHQDNRAISWIKASSSVLLGVLYIAFLSQITIPLKPIPVTMQTFAIFSLALFQGSKKASFSVLLYLFAATLGLPVLSAGNANPLWFIFPSAGYCLSYPVAAYLIGKLTELKRPLNAIETFLGMCFAQLIIYAMGVAWLSTFLGFNQALMVGVYPFVVFDTIKLLGALSAKMATKHLSSYAHLFIRRFIKR